MLKKPWLWALAPAILVACGTDKDYGAPLEDPNASLTATATVDAVSRLELMSSNESALRGLDAATAGINRLTGIKFQERQGGFEPEAELTERSMRVDDGCVEISETEIRYTDCAYADSTVNGDVSYDGVDFRADLRFVSIDEDDDGVTTRTTDIRAALEITEQGVSGNIDSDLDIDGPQFDLSGSLFGDFDVVLEDGCAVGGSVEMNAVAKTFGQSESIWVLAEFGPACGDVVVR